MPNIITPNGDNINDVIDFGNYPFSSLSVTIFNRWGEKVYESVDPKNVWSPNVNDGVYFYTLQYRIDCAAETQAKSIAGFIQILR